MRSLIILIISTFFSAAAYAQCDQCARLLEDTEKARMESNHSLMLGYQYASTWVVGKKSVLYTYVAGRTWSFELEYGTSERAVDIGKFDIGKIKEDRYTLFSKYYISNSFHFSFGPYFYAYDIDTAGSIRNSLNGILQKTWNIQGFGAAVSFGNRWQNSWGLTWGVDWARMNYPLVTTWENVQTGEVETTTRKDTDRTIDIIKNIPTFAFLCVNAGFTF